MTEKQHPDPSAVGLEQQSLPAQTENEDQDRAPELTVAFDMLKRSIFVAVPLLVAGFWGWSWSGLVSVLIALTLVLINLILGAQVIAFGVLLDDKGFMATVLGGYLLRLGIIAVAMLSLRNQDWFEMTPFAVSLLTTHIGLLAVECRHVSLSSAHPGLKPSVKQFNLRRSHEEPLDEGSSSRLATYREHL